MRRSFDTPRRNDDRYAGVIAAVSQARERIRLYEREDETGAQSPTRRPRSRSFGINPTISEGNAINLDLQSVAAEPTHSPQTRHVTRTPYSQHQQQLPLSPSSNSTPQIEPQQLPSNFGFGPTFASQVPLFHPPVAPTFPPVTMSYPTMSAYPAQFLTPVRTSPYVLPTPLVPIPSLIPTPMATSLTLPSSWAPNTPQIQLPAAYGPSPATSMRNSNPDRMAASSPSPPGNVRRGVLVNASTRDSKHSADTATPGHTFALSGGLPLPGTQPFWAPTESWPPSESTLPLHVAPWLAPNPANADRPHVVWDVSEPPSKARRISGKDIFVDMQDAFSPDATAVFPETDEIVVVCNTDQEEQITSGDVFWAIYEFFQKPITRDEVELIKSRSEDEFRRLVEACYRRCLRAPGLADITRRQGVKRVDCLEDRTAWWGMWPVWAVDGTWSLHLGLMPSPRA
ncbi:hypothetical protein B0F90DRAFT_1760912 [Multifurca ochricompacta]|uniref:DUF6699 domain-containing protein n=1 Tax=Multifurca ochricompacta TaxID=376703 RepID=A0AAD4LX15_9AGAM|nr:hypothetical protein B0F90DRAFT_1760912 [Multifurca ochricompacta]